MGKNAPGVSIAHPRPTQMGNFTQTNADNKYTVNRKTETAQSEVGSSYKATGNEQHADKVKSNRHSSVDDLASIKSGLDSEEKKKDSLDPKKESDRSAFNAKLDSVLLQLQTAGDKKSISGIELQGDKVSIKLTLAAINEEVLTKLKEIGFELVSKSGKTVSGRITVAALQKLCEIKAVLRIQATRLGANQVR